MPNQNITLHINQWDKINQVITETTENSEVIAVNVEATNLGDTIAVGLVGNDVPPQFLVNTNGETFNIG